MISVTLNCSSCHTARDVSEAALVSGFPKRAEHLSFLKMKLFGGGSYSQNRCDLRPLRRCRPNAAGTKGPFRGLHECAPDSGVV